MPVPHTKIVEAMDVLSVTVLPPKRTMAILQYSIFNFMTQNFLNVIFILNDGIREWIVMDSCTHFGASTY